MTMLRRIAPLVLILGLAACETGPTAFAPAPSADGLGYLDQKIEQDRYRVTYRGTDHPMAPAEDLALLRAADLTLAEGYDWFRVVHRSDAIRASNAPTIGIGTGGTSFGRHSAVGLGVGTSFSLGAGPIRTVTLEIQLEKGGAPHEPDAYDAHDAAKTIRARL